MSGRSVKTASGKPVLTRIWVVALLAMTSCALWGSAPAAIKTGYRLYGIEATESAQQLLFAGLRFFLSGILSVLFGSLFSRKLLVPRKRITWGKILILCLVQTVLQYIFYYIGVAHTTGVKAAVLSGLNAFLALLIASLLFHQEKLTARKLAGCALGFLGVILVNVVGSGGLTFDFHLLGEGFVFFSVVTYALSSTLLRAFGEGENPVVLSGWQFLTGGLILMGIGYLAGARITVTTGPQLAILLYLAFVSATAYAIWAVLLKYNPVSAVTIFSFSNPVFGVLISAIWLGEKSSIGVVTILALLLVSLGIVIVNRGKQHE